MQNTETTRRQFIQKTAANAALAATFANISTRAYAAGSDTIKLGLIGCGGRGRGAAVDALSADPGTKLIAIADVFDDQIQGAIRSIRDHENPDIGKRYAVTDDMIFKGFDGYRRVLETDADYVLIALPPYFHSIYAEAALDAGKHVFVEKPCGVDIHGVKQMYACQKKAEAQGLGVMSGTQRRHHSRVVEAIGRIHAGEIGKVNFFEASWCAGPQKWVGRGESMSEMEWQIRDYLRWQWCGGDLPGLYAIHQVDVMNWVMGDEVPYEAFGTGGVHDADRQGNTFDHFSVHLKYSDDRQGLMQARLHQGAGRVGMLAVGTEGTCDPMNWIRGNKDSKRFDGGERAYIVEHRNMLKSIRADSPIRQAKQLADATLATLMAREAAYSGERVTKDFMLNKATHHTGLSMPIDAFKLGDVDNAPRPAPGQYKLS